MIYFLFACFCVFFAFCWLQIRKVRKHDDVLFPLCQLRRDIVRFLYVNVFEKENALSPEEVRAARWLWGLLDRTIRDYNQNKTTIFNLRTMLKIVRQYRNLMEQIEPVNLTKNKEIQRLHQRFVLCWAKGCLTYTPLIRSEIALWFFMLIARKVSIRMRREASKVVEVAAQIRSHAAVV